MFSYLSKVYSLLTSGERTIVLVLFLLMAVSSLIEVAAVAAIPVLVSILTSPESILENEKYAEFLSRFGVNDTSTLIYWGGGFVLAAFLLKNAFLIFYKYVSTGFVFRIYRRLGDRLFRSYMNAPYVHWLSRNSSELLRNVTQETHLLVVKVLFSFLKLSMDALVVAAILLLLLYVESLVTIAVFSILGGGSVLFMRLLRGGIKKHGKQEQEYRARMIKSVNEGLGGMKELKASGRTSFFTRRFSDEISKTSFSFRFKEFMRQIIVPGVETFAVFGMMVIAGLLIAKGKSIQEIIPLLTLFIAATARLMPALKKTIHHYTVIKYHTYVVDPVFRDMSAQGKEPQFEQQKKQGNPVTFDELLEFKDLSFAYPETSEKAIDSISFSVKKGDVVAFVGRSGAGKTTVADVFLGLLEPQKGTVSADGIDVDLSSQAWKTNVGYIPQQIFLIDDTIRANIALGIPEAEIDDAKIESAINAAQLRDVVDGLPDGINTKTGEYGVRLSGGQRQRIGIARALYNDPSILVMDEATSALDNQTERFVMQAIDEFRRDRTIVIIAHRLSTVKNADRIFIMDSGKITDSGTYNELMQKSESFKKLAGETEFS